jgi:hypothetical protein
MNSVINRKIIPNNFVWHKYRESLSHAITTKPQLQTVSISDELVSLILIKTAMNFMIWSRQNKAEKIKSYELKPQDKHYGCSIN